MQNWKQFKHVTDPYWIKDNLGSELNAEQMWDDLMEQFGAYPDGVGNICFDTEEGELFFILKHAKQNDYVG